MREERKKLLAPLIKERDRVTRIFTEFGFTPEDLATNGKKHGRQSAWHARWVIAWRVWKEARLHGYGVRDVAEVLGISVVAATNNAYSVTQALKGNNYPMISKLVAISEKKKPEKTP